MNTATAIRSRRTVKHFTGAVLGRPQVEELITLACWAPTHRLSQPWRFYACDQEALRRLAGRLTTDPTLSAALDPRRAAKTLELLGQAGALVVVTVRRNADPRVDREDLAATAAAVQNLLLAATAAGLGGFWSTNPLFAQEVVLRLFGADPAQEDLVAAVFLGIPANLPEPPPRHPLSERLHWADLPG
jgi:nitroreductase